MSTAKSPAAGSYLWITATLLASSIEPIIAKMGYAANCTPLQLLCLKSLVGAIVICPLTRQKLCLDIAGLKRIVPVALLLLCTSGLVLSSLKFIKASLLITIVTVTPAAVALVNQSLGRELLGVKFWIGFLMAAAGLSLTAGSELGSISIVGIILALAAVASSTTYRVLLEKVTREYKPALVSTYIFLINGICMLPILPFISTEGLPTNIIASGLWLGMAAAVANVAFLYAISQLGATRVSIISMLERPIVICIAAVVLKEFLNVWQIAGIVLVVMGVQLAKVKRKGVVQDRTASSTDPGKIDCIKTTFSERYRQAGGSVEVAEIIKSYQSKRGIFYESSIQSKTKRIGGSDLQAGNDPRLEPRAAGLDCTADCHRYENEERPKQNTQPSQISNILQESDPFIVQRDTKTG